MRKFLFLSLIFGLVLSSNAQKYTAKKLNQAKAVTIHKDRKIELGQDVPILPILKPSRAHSKAIQSVLIGTSGNAYTFIYEPNYQLDAKPELNMIAYVHRAGGQWGGSSGELRVPFSYDFGYTWTDSVVFGIQQVNHLYRYPNVIIHNPEGNTDPANSYIIVQGPITDGSGWKYNYFDSKKKTGDNLTINHLTPPTSSGNSPVLERLNLSGGTTYGNNGRYYTMWQDDDGNYYLGKAYVRKMYFDEAVNGVVVDTNFTGPLFKAWKLRQFSNASVEWAFAWNNQFDTYKGFVWTPSGCDSTSDWYNMTGLPHIWETWDGAENFVTYPAFGCWHKLTNLIDQIWPVRQSFIEHPNNPELWEYRVNFAAGSTVDENFSPGVIDYQGNLHMLAIVEGMYSNHPDSLNYVYANQPIFLFDVYTTGWNWDGSARTWDVQFIDTLRTQVVQDENSPFGDENGIGWGHSLGIATSPDKKVIFIIWTDTDPQFDTVNTMPEIKARAWNVETFMATPVINFTPGEGGMFFFCNYPHYVLEDGNDYVIPMSYIDVYSEPNAINPQQHYFAAGLRISKNDFTIQLSPSDPALLATCTNTTLIKNNPYIFEVSQNTPNPAKEYTYINITLTEKANVNVVITNVIGQKVMTINKENLSAGRHSIIVNTGNLQNGVYFYTVNVNGQSITKKMIIE